MFNIETLKLNLEHTRTTRIVPLPRARRAAADVTIDGQHNCSFDSLEAAVMAADDWRDSWPAVRNRRVRVVPRLSWGART